MKIDRAQGNIIDKSFKKDSKVYLLDNDKLKFSLEENSLKSNPNKIIYLPNENGDYEKFEINNTKLLSKELSIKYPDIKTFVGLSKERSEVKVRITITNKGLSYWLRIPDSDDYFFQPVRNKKDMHYGYSNSNLINNQFNCKTEFIKNKLFK